MRIQLSDHFSYQTLFRFTLPSIAMMIFTSIYGVVDGFFVSNYAGKTPFAALNLIFPFIMILGTMGFMIGTGGSALVASQLGQGDEKQANRTFSMMVLFTVLTGVVLTVLGLVFVRPVAILLGATENMVEDCVLYGSVCIAFTMPFMLQNVFQSFLAAAEKPRLGLAVTVAAGLTNCVLDALFIAVFQWGLAGAALATGLGQLVGGVLPLIYFARPNSSLLRLTRTRLERRPLLKACANGSSELMSNISSSLVSVLYNWQLMRFIGEDGVSAYGVLMYVQFIFIAIYLGYSIGSAPIVSYHYGAGNHAELKNLRRKGFTLTGFGGVVLTLIALLLSSPLARLFVGYDPELYALTVHALRLFSFSFLLCGFNIYASGFFTALNNGGVSAAISFLRTLVFQSLSVILLPLLFGMDGIWLAITLAEVLACFVSLLFLKSKQKTYQY